MDNNSASKYKSDWRFLQNFALAILFIVILMGSYYAMWKLNEFVFGKLNDLLGLLFSCLYLTAILCLHPVMFVGAFKGKKGQPNSRTKITGKPASPEGLAQEDMKWKNINRRLTMAVMQLIIIDIIVRIFWWIPTWPRWIVLFLTVGSLAYYLSSRYGEGRGVYSGLGQFGIIFLGWLLGRWTGIIFFSAPLLIVYYLMLYRFAIVIIPANNPENDLVLFDKNNEKWLRFLAFTWYTWGIQHPMNVVVDDAGREIAMRIKGSPFPEYGMPGIILTRSHQVVGITAGTEFSRIEGPGVVFTRRFERLLGIVDLRKQIRTAWIDAVTKDGVPFRAKLFMVFKVNDSSPDHIDGSFPYSKKWIRRLLKLLGVVQNQSNDKTNLSWDERVVKIIEQTAQQVLSQRTVNELWQPQNSAAYNSAFVEIGEEIKSILQKRMEDQGVIVFTSRMPDFKFSEEKEDAISSQQLTTWRSSWARQADQTIAEGEAEANRLEEEARAYAQSVLLKAFAEGIKHTTPEMSRYVIAIRFISAIQELMKKHPDVAENLGPEVIDRFENIKQRITPL
jgi:regulator of protease activity HflC (stomatin/prohibitin superfamily)